MIDSVKDLPVSHQIKVTRPQEHESLIDKDDLKGILFLGVKGDLSGIVDSGKVDILV